MGKDIEIKVVFNHFDKIAKELRADASKIVRGTAFDIEAQAAANAPVDTGALKNSIYTVTDRSSNYSERKASADSDYKKSHPNSEFPMLEEEGAPPSLTAIVAVGAEYGVHVEYGTHDTPAQPFLAPAVKAVEPQFQELMKGLLKG